MSVVTKPRRKVESTRDTEAMSGRNGERLLDTDVPDANGETASATEKSDANGNGNGEVHHATDMQVAMLKRGSGRQWTEVNSVTEGNLDSICRSLQSLERQRRFALKQCIRGENAITAFVACNAFAYHSGIQSEAEREKLWKDAGKLIKAIDSGETVTDTDGGRAAEDDDDLDAETEGVQDDGDGDAESDSVADDSGDEQSRDTDRARVTGVVRISKISRKAWSDYEKGLMDKMVELAGQLPVASWLSEPECRGISLGMLATIVGESGNLSNYSNPAKLWKRLFGAPIEKNGKTMMPSRWRLEKGLSAEDWEDAGYSPHRHATMQQMKKNIVRQNGDGPYRRRYDEAKARTREVHPEWWLCYKCEGKGKANGKKCQNCKGTGEVAMHAHRHAQLLAAKRFVRDLWNKWHGKAIDAELCGVPRKSL